MSAAPLIPIKNVYYILCYAWDRPWQGDATDVGVDSIQALPDLFAYVLIDGVERLLRAGLDRGYEPTTEITATPRGRINYLQSVRLATVATGKLVCEPDELTYDVLHNQLIKTTIRRLATAVGLSTANRDELQALYRRMNGVGEANPSPAAFARAKPNTSRSLYGFILHVCNLVCESLLPDTEHGRRRFADFTRDEEKMRLIFQAFVANYLRRHLGLGCRVGGRQTPWIGLTGDSEAVGLVPTLNTDVVVECLGQVLVIDTKFTAKAKTHGRFGKERFQPSHLFQLFAYVKNTIAVTPAKPTKGLLLYPQVSTAFSHDFQLGGHPFRVASIDLNAPSPLIGPQLVGLVKNVL